MSKIRGKIVTEHEVFGGIIKIENQKITEIKKDCNDEKVDFDFGNNLILPGFIDLHIHGIDKFTMYEAEDIAGAALCEVKFGTTGFLPTVASATKEQHLNYCDNIRKAQKITEGKGANIFGAHFEGPFIGIERKGGMDADYLLEMDLKFCEDFLNRADGLLKLITLSPELPGADDVIKMLVKNNVTVAVGHSIATPEQLSHAVELGVNHSCHLYNAYEKIEEKEGGVWSSSLITEILLHDEIRCELICDMHHVMPQLIKLALKTAGPDRIITITDGMQGTGVPVGRHKMLDGRTYDTSTGAGRIVKENGELGGLTGSVLTMNKGFENIVEICGFDLVTAAKATSLNPARAIKADQNYGSIACNKIADIAVLDKSYNCIATFMAGKQVHSS